MHVCAYEELQNVTSFYIERKIIRMNYSLRLIDTELVDHYDIRIFIKVSFLSMVTEMIFFTELQYLVLVEAAPQ